MRASAVAPLLCCNTACLPVALLLLLLLQNLLSNDCAKARVGLCVAKDPLCLPFQNIIDSNGSSSAAAVGAVTPVLDATCPVAEPTQPGVKVCACTLPELRYPNCCTQLYCRQAEQCLQVLHSWRTVIGLTWLQLLQTCLGAAVPGWRQLCLNTCR